MNYRDTVIRQQRAEAMAARVTTVGGKVQHTQEQAKPALRDVFSRNALQVKVATITTMSISDIS